MARSFLPSWAALTGVLALACAAPTIETAQSGSGGGGRTGTPNGAGDPGSGGAPLFMLADAGVPMTKTDAGAGIPIPSLTEFTMTESGGYKLGPPPSAKDLASVSGPDGCVTLVALVRDFKGANQAGGHPDFEAFTGHGATTGLVAAMLGSDRKPVYASRCELTPDPAACPSGQMTTSKAAFDQWYRNSVGTNQTFLLFLAFAQNGSVSTFESGAFLPLDNAGWGNSASDHQGVAHNYGFTTELHAAFKYQGGEQFTFVGDDDLWVFINSKLALDLGGTHTALRGTVALDASAASLGLVKGMVYPLELFHAERHSVASHFRVDTNFAFVDCGRIVE
jgi:fibro-slime domain-containing protein